MASAATPSEEQQSQSLTTRITKDGRKISYRLTVVQQPERARACGQGAKSSSDRRPVDPPPIVELRVYEGDQNTDITFPYNASFFLYATLEPARPLAHARGSQAQANSAILTGAPAVGISYLDRPQPAGYFIFPDLSVRHEGQYRLKFALFEAIKEPQDADLNAPANELIGSHYHNRGDVESAPFHVYSAKKFPGLTESTLLSRVVADQGCRVRIRRDVRMRRRDSKAEKDWEFSESEGPPIVSAHAEASAPNYDSKTMGSVTDPGEQSEKQLESAPSSTSTHALQVPPATQPMQQVMQAQAGFTYPQWYQYSPATQALTQHMYAPHVPAEPAYMQHQHQHPYQSSYSPTHAQQMGHVPQYASYTYQHPVPVSMVQNEPLTYNSQSQQQMSPAYGPVQQYPPSTPMRPQTAVYHPAYSQMDRDNQSGVQYGYQQQQPQPMSYQQPSPSQATHPQQPAQQQFDTNDNPTQPANVPLVTGKLFPPMEVPRVSHTTAEAVVSPIHATAVGRQFGEMGPPHAVSRPPPPPQQYLTHTVNSVGHKRSYGATFNTLHTQEAMRNGARPNAETVPDWPDPNEEDLQDLEQIKMTYRRADGSYTVVSPRQFRMP